LDAEIRLVYKNVREAEAVANAVTPDNTKLPPGLRIRTERKGSRVITEIKCGTRLQTFMATIDDLLESVSVAENTFKVAKKSQS